VGPSDAGGGKLGGEGFRKRDGLATVARPKLQTKSSGRPQSGYALTQTVQFLRRRIVKHTLNR
jgi:hypothetical protein